MFKPKLLSALLPVLIFVGGQLHAQTADSVGSIQLADVDYTDSPDLPTGYLMDPVAPVDAGKIFRSPSGLTNVCFFSLMLQSRQHQYAQYLKGQLKDSGVIKALLAADPASFAGRDLNMSINLLSGLDSQRRRIFIVDNNNNSDFTDDHVWLVDSFKTSRQQYSAVTNLEIFNPISHQVQNARVHVSPVIDKPHSYTLKNQSPTDCYQELDIRPDCRAGTITLTTGDSLHVVVSTKNMLNRYFDKKTTEIFPYLNGKLFLHKTSYNRCYSIGDTLRINDSKYICFVESPADGTGINFRYITAKERPLGYEVNFQSIPISSVDIVSQQPFLSSDYLGKKYILLDFWGTWCVPCKETTPGLIALHRSFESQIAFASVAFDYDVEKVKDYVKKEHLNWTQLFEQGGHVDPISGITKNYAVGAYPTFILIDKKGEIVFRDIGTDGFQRLKDFIQKAIPENQDN